MKKMYQINIHGNSAVRLQGETGEKSQTFQEWEIRNHNMKALNQEYNILVCILQLVFLHF